jgi:O-methyltransferase
MTKDKDLYLNLMKKTLTFYIWGEVDKPIEMWWFKGIRKVCYRNLMKFLTKRGFYIAKKITFDEEARRNGKDWPQLAHTMTGLKRLDCLQKCVEDVLENKVLGDFIETGAWRGGSSIFMRAVLKAYGDTTRKVWVADSFEGLPKPDADKYPEDAGDILYTHDFLRVSLEQVKENFRSYDLLDEQVQFLKGWFKDTLPTAPIKQLAVIRLDGDLYESTMDGLTNLYPKLSKGGYVIVDDFNLDMCVKAVKDFRRDNNITDEIIDIDGTGVYWQRS